MKGSDSASSPPKMLVAQPHLTSLRLAFSAQKPLQLTCLDTGRIVGLQSLAESLLATQLVELVLSEAPAVTPDGPRLLSPILDTFVAASPTFRLRRLVLVEGFAVAAESAELIRSQSAWLEELAVLGCRTAAPLRPDDLWDAVGDCRRLKELAILLCLDNVSSPESLGQRLCAFTCPAVLVGMKSGREILRAKKEPELKYLRELFLDLFDVSWAAPEGRPALFVGKGHTRAFIEASAQILLP